MKKLLLLLSIASLSQIASGMISVEKPDTASALFQCIEYRKSYKEIERAILNNNGNVSIRNEQDETPLLAMTKDPSFCNDVKTFELLLKHGADANAQDLDGWTPFISAVLRKFSPKICKLLINNGLKINYTDKHGINPLSAAIGASLIDISIELIKRGSPLNSDHLALAACEGLFEICELLIDKGVDVNSAADTYKTALMCAAEYNQLEICKLLITRGAHINARDSDGNTALMRATWEGHLAICNFLIKNGATPNTQAEDFDYTPLHIAAENGNLELCKLFIKGGAKASAINKGGNTPLHRAANKGHLEICKLLIEKKANINARNASKVTPLVCASWAGHLAICKLLIKHGAKIKVRDWEGKSPLARAAENNHLEICQLLINKGGDVNTKDRRGNTPLILATKEGHEDVAILLADIGGDINIEDPYGNTPLLLALKNGLKKAAKKLIEKGSYVNAKNNSDEKPLLLAIENNDLENSELLIQKGADINCRTHGEFGDTPLLLAGRQNNLELCTMLIKKGSNIDATVKNKRGVIDLSEDYVDHGTLLCKAVRENNLDLARGLIVFPILTAKSANFSESFERIRTALLCFKRFALSKGAIFPKDVQYYIFTLDEDLRNDIVQICSGQILKGCHIPKTFLQLALPTIIESTKKQQKLIMAKEQQCGKSNAMKDLLDPNKLEPQLGNAISQNIITTLYQNKHCRPKIATKEIERSCIIQ